MLALISALPNAPMTYQAERIAQSRQKRIEFLDPPKENAFRLSRPAWRRSLDRVPPGGDTELSATRKALAAMAGQTWMPYARRQASAIP